MVARPFGSSQSSWRPSAPTFGFRLVGGKGVGGGLEGVIHTLGWAAEMGADIFHTATDAWDKHFLSKATIVRTCVGLQR